MFSNGKEVTYDVLGNGNSIEIYPPTDSRTLTSLKMLMKEKLKLMSGAPLGMSLPYKEKDLNDVKQLFLILTTPPINYRK